MSVSEDSDRSHQHSMLPTVIIPDRSALLFFDTLNIYLHPSDPAAQARINDDGIIDRMVRIAGACREAGIPVFYAQADHRPDGKDFVPTVVDRGYDLPDRRGPRITAPPPVAAGGHGAEIIPELAPQAGDYVIKKHRWSSFYQTHLELSLRAAGIDTLLLSGGSTEVGIASTAYSARDRDFNLVILRDACRSLGAGVNEMLMDSVFPIFARVMAVSGVIAEIQVAR